ncbi:ARF/SAR family small GTPase [Naegleria gruberi]|uniref:ARF/SAR family small GTPase n=1 Tax=Naegleria gruberi TaxID=5762 RepID=D2V1Z2_NAEGR|nr:ARF/SAR family small GTPase [Naegleria gruberi]EFC49396.1 ARF/SAR family small GTPase [Naegleria gruberi]|eukprot:XP_002682140.1 ARF/SAR family small GTPase [Naegleria gruberi strain NEG-M]
MGLMSILKKLREQERQMRVLILGLDNAGKTTIVKKLKNQPLDEISPTLGFNIDTIYYEKDASKDVAQTPTNNTFKVNFWDIGGQKSIRSYWRNYFENTDGLIWVIDSADTDRLEDCKRELNLLLGEEKLAGASLLILANKSDLDNALSVSDIAKFLGLEQLSQTTETTTTRHIHVERCSAITGEGISEGIDWIVDDIANRIFLME